MPFLVSVILLAISVYIRLKLAESPLFVEMKAEGTQSRAPLTESFGQWRNLKIVLLALFGATCGQGVVWYTGQFYALFFLQNTLKVDFSQSYILLGIALLIGTPFFVVFGRLSDRIGRKRIIVAGCVLAMLTLFPIFRGLTHFANPALAEFEQRAAITVAARDCHFNIFAKPTTPCDRARDFLTKAGFSYESRRSTARTMSSRRSPASRSSDSTRKRTARRSNAAAIQPAADPARVNAPMTVLLLVVLMVYVTMVYGPIAAFLVELFPTRIRYSSMSLPYHIGNGWFGGFLPFIAAALVVKSGNIYYGLWYPIVVAAITAVVGGLFIEDRRDVDLRSP